MQRIHPEDDLLQAARRHHPHQHTVSFGQRDAPGLDPWPARDPTCADTCGNGTASSLISRRSGRALQVGDMPAEARNQERRAWSSARMSVRQVRESVRERKPL